VNLRSCSESTGNLAKLGRLSASGDDLKTLIQLPFFRGTAMETLAYLYGAEDYESEAKEINLGGLKTVVTTGLIAAGVTAGAISTSADSASAYGYGRYHGGYYGGGYRHVSYYRPVYYPRHYYAYPVYYRPCRSSYYY
jgi:hypothetical protein